MGSDVQQCVAISENGQQRYPRYPRYPLPATGSDRLQQAALGSARQRYEVIVSGTVIGRDRQCDEERVAAECIGSQRTASGWLAAAQPRTLAGRNVPWRP
eukprot:2201415-Pleurochrysis_carterae.AAC.1